MSETVINGFGSFVARVGGKDNNLTIYLKKDFCELCDIAYDDILELEIKKIKRAKRK
ncbi:MAG: hypothetical protein ABH864_03880 [archaeon]